MYEADGKYTQKLLETYRFATINNKPWQFLMTGMFYVYIHKRNKSMPLCNHKMFLSFAYFYIIVYPYPW